MSKILCFCPVLGDTKDSKRVKLLQKGGHNVTVVCFERDYFPSRLPDCKIIKLGRIENGKYLKRILIMISSIFKFRKLSKKYDIVYALSPDLAFMSYLALLFKNKIIIMDVADIREVQVANNIFGIIVRFLDKFIAEKSDLIVVTSEAFIHEYYIRKLGANVKDFFLLENKVDYSDDVSSEFKKTIDKDKISIGYFGVLRDSWTIDFLLNVLTTYPEKFQIVVAGINMIDKFDLDDLSKKYKNFYYLGPYKSPNDLTNLYDKVDVIAVFYPEFSKNKEWFNARKLCRTNRYYEACFFKKPLLAFSFSEDGKLIQDLNIGITIDSYKIYKNTIEVSKHLTKGNLLIWKKNLRNLPESTYIFKDESHSLNIKIKNLINI